MPSREDIVVLAAYNASMNHKLYAAAATLPHAELCADWGAFFSSLLGTLNHIIASDTICLHHFTGHPSGFGALGLYATWQRLPASASSLARTFLLCLTIARGWTELSQRLERN